ncbi:hypothetical protein TKK_0003012 [Trichogramma kaykai]|uniref:BEN domain-containing protein n=1 Tax=Trichogramma kaykai TaxID=54128 RepID=A0ABD2XQR8_9HYME
MGKRKSTHAIEVDKQSEENEISSEEDSESTDEEEGEKKTEEPRRIIVFYLSLIFFFQLQVKKKTTQKETLLKRKLLLQTENLKMKTPTSGKGLKNSSSGSTVNEGQEKRDSKLFENFQQSIQRRSKNTSIPSITTSHQEDMNRSEEEKERENDDGSYNNSNDNSPFSHFSTKNQNDEESDDAKSPRRVSFFFHEGKILQLQQKIDNLQYENQELRTTIEKTNNLYKKAQEKLCSYLLVHQRMKEILQDEESESNLQDYSSMYDGENNGFNSMETSTPSNSTTSKNSKRSAKDSGLGEIEKVEKKLKTSEEPQKIIKIIFDRKIPHLPDSSGKSFGTKFTLSDSTESMIHLRYSYSIQHEEWKSLLKQPSESLFCKKLLEALYPWDELKRICVKQKPKTPIRTPNGVNTKSEIPEEFHHMTKKALEYYIKYKATNPDCISTRLLLEKLKNVGHYFSEHIKSVTNRKEPKKKEPKNT